MDKLKMQTPDLTDKNIEQIAALFPNVITETKDENDNLKKAVDFDLLKQALSKNLVEADNERYRLDWPGKKASLLKANTPITKTLRPCKEESVNFDTTENLYIEGDNFEVLKILQESYLGKVKMIYIDPPYNTGKDFIYKDDFKKSKEAYEEELGIEDEDGGKLFKNTDSNGRFHSDWLSMVYERLVVARDILSDDGVIFISIDDIEQSSLKILCDEVFGECNNYAQINWTARNKPMNSGSARFKLQKSEEFILVYGKITMQEQKPFNLEGSGQKVYNLIENGEEYRLEEIQQRKNIGIKRSEKMAFDIEGAELKDEYRWTIGPDTAIALRAKNKLIIKNKKAYQKIFRKEEDSNSYYPLWANFAESVGTSEEGKAELFKLLDDNVGFETVKPVSLIKKICYHFTKANDIILDFFSGSATTAHAVMQLNAEDGGNRKFIMVQLPEKTDENSEAYKAGYKTIAEIGKERIRRAGKKILSELESKSQQLKLGEEPVDASKLDIGFRVYKTDSTNMKDVFYHPSELKQMTLDDLLSNIKEDRTPEDLLTQVILDLGLELSLPIETKKILGNTVFIVQTNALVACFDNDIDFKIVDTISDLKPLKVVFKDAGFKDDKDRINVEERFKRLSPETKVTVI